MNWQERVEKKIDLILATLIGLEEWEMASAQDILDAVAKEKTVVASVLTLVQGLKDQLANAGVPQATLDAIFDGVTADTAALNTVLTTPGT